MQVEASKIERIETAVAELSHDELDHFREWFEAYAAEQWDRQIEEDIRAGRLDNLAEQALRDFEAGRCTEL